MTTINTINPATEASINNDDLMSEDAAFQQVEACHAVFLKWREKTHEKKGVVAYKGDLPQ